MCERENVSCTFPFIPTHVLTKSFVLFEKIALVLVESSSSSLPSAVADGLLVPLRAPIKTFERTSSTSGDVCAVGLLDDDDDEDELLEEVEVLQSEQRDLKRLVRSIHISLRCVCVCVRACDVTWSPASSTQRIQEMFRVVSFLVQQGA